MGYFCLMLVSSGPIEPGRSPLRLATARDQTGLLEKLEVLGDRGKRHVERLGQLRDRRLAGPQAGEDRPAGRIGEGGEDGAESVGRHFSFNLTVT